MLNKTKQYINGQWVDSHSDAVIEVINPATEEIVGVVANGNEKDVDDAVNAADAVYIQFKNSSVKERQDILGRIIEAYQKRKDDLVDTVTSELGCPLDKAENTHYAAGINHFQIAKDALDTFDFEEQKDTSLVLKEAIGVSALITPWNFPTNQAIKKIAAAFAAGCPVVLKPSEETPLSAVLLAEIFDAADVPKGVFNLVNGDGANVGGPLSKHPKVRMVSFTGSAATGSKIMSEASKDIKKVGLELGGKSPYIILDDVDIDAAAKSAVQKVVNNTGQVCVAGTRTLVPEALKDTFLEKVKNYMDEVTIGDPRKESTDMGPIISEKQFNQVQSYINKGIEEGATLYYGGPGKPEGFESGYFVKPTVFSNVDNGMTIAQEEIFGPVMSVITYSDIDEAIEIANDTKYGLAGYAMGEDRDSLKKIARSIEAGSITINDTAGTSDLPFGGFKQSGLGRESGTYGIEEFLEVKTIKGYFE